MNDIKSLAIGAGAILGAVAAVVIGTGIAAFIYTVLYDPTPAEIFRLTVQLLGAVVVIYIAMGWMDE